MVKVEQGWSAEACNAGRAHTASVLTLLSARKSKPRCWSLLNQVRIEDEEIIMKSVDEIAVNDEGYGVLTSEELREVIDAYWSLEEGEDWERVPLKFEEA